MRFEAVCGILEAFLSYTFMHTCYCVIQLSFGVLIIAIHGVWLELLRIKCNHVYHTILPHGTPSCLHTKTSFQSPPCTPNFVHTVFKHTYSLCVSYSVFKQVGTHSMASKSTRSNQNYRWQETHHPHGILHIRVCRCVGNARKRGRYTLSAPETTQLRLRRPQKSTNGLCLNPNPLPLLFFVIL